MSQTTRIISAITAGAVLSLATAGCSVLDLLIPEFDTSSVNSTVIPLSMPKVNDDHPIATAAVSIAGGPEVPLLVDTGSPGIRVFAGSVGDVGLTRTNKTVDVSFADGTRFVGVEASAPVTVGGLATAGPIKIQLITEVSCVDGKPDCVGAQGTNTFVRDQPFDGLLGISLQANDIYSPISQLSGGSPASYSISIDRRKRNGTLRFNQQPTEVAATFSIPSWMQPRLANGYPAWFSNATNACWSYAPQTTACVPTAFDTGSPTLFTNQEVPGSPSELGPVPAGSTVLLSEQAGSAPVWQVTSGRVPARNLVEVATLDNSNDVNSGLSIFGDYVVTFDLQYGKVILGK